MEIAFFIGVIGVLYSYLLYPAVLQLVPKRRPTGVGGIEETPMVSIVIAVHNEATRIGAKLRNTLAIDYPKDRLEIIVASDASTDGTDAIVQDVGGRRVQLVRIAERRGKECAQEQAIAASTGRILVFSDAGTEIEPLSIKRIVADFRDPKVGAVSSEDRFRSRDGGLVGEGAYIKYEMWLRALESNRSGLVGLSGSFFAARREVCAGWDVHAPSDFNTALNCAQRGYVAISDPQVIGYYQDLKEDRREYGRKMRTVLRGLTGLLRHPEVLNVFRYKWFAFQVWSHKVMRWLVPWFMVAVLVSSATLAMGSGVFLAFTGLQVAVYALSGVASIVPGLRKHVLVKIPYYFLQVNLAIAHATLAYALGRRIAVWTPSSR